MNIRQMVSAALTACAAQGVAFFVSIVMSFVIPKLLGIESYGYWQLFVFYAGYSGFFHFGLNDGIYLIEGGKRRDQLDRQRVASQFWMSIVIQIMVASAVAVLACYGTSDSDRFFVFVSFSIYTVIYNTSCLLGYLFQAMNETKLFSYMTMLERGVFLIPLITFVLLHQDDYRLLVLSYIFSRSLALAYAIWMARDVIFTCLFPPLQALKECLKSISVGFNLMIANVADMFIIGVSRVLVDNAWGIAVFGQVSFSLSIVNFFITFVTQASMVLFPVLRQGTVAERRRFFSRARDAMDVLFPAAYVLYFPLAGALKTWLPEYYDSVRYFALLMPICVYNAKMFALCQTYYKVLRKERVLLYATCLATVCNSFFTLVGIYVMGSLEAVLSGTVLVIASRTIVSERYLSRRLKVPVSNMSSLGVLVSLVFVLAALMLPPSLALISFTIVYLGYLYVSRSTVEQLVRIALRVFGR